MLSAVIFGLDMGTFGIAHGLPSFLSHWCAGGGYQLGSDADSCLGPHAPKNKVWIHQFVIPSVLLNLGAAAMSCVFLAPTAIPLLGHRITTNVALGITILGCVLHSFLAAAADPMHIGKDLWFIGRFLLGLGIGLLFATMPQWNAELVTKEIRGITGAIMQVTNIMGVLLGGLVTLAVKSNSMHQGVSASTDLGWEIPTSLTGFFAVALLIPVNLVPDSPVWLLNQYLQLTDGKEKTKLHQAATSSMKTLRTWRGREAEVLKYQHELQERIDPSSDTPDTPVCTLDDVVWRRVFCGDDCEDVAERVLEIEAALHIFEVQSSQPPVCKEFLTNEPQRLLQRTLISIYVGGIGQNLAGMIALNNISFQLFTEVGMDRPFASTAIFDCLQLAGAIAGAMCLDGLKWGGRRLNLLVGSALLGMFMLIVGGGLLTVQQLKDSNQHVPKSLHYLNFACLLLYAFTFHATWAAAWVYPAEISYASERARIASFAMGAHFGGATVLVGVIALLFAWSKAGTMFVFAVGNGISFLIVYLFTVETKNKQIGDIIAKFRK
eukprot:TRINITY_DN76985_c0_g1_i1.p1 TRINITY_DN76985_c0_g1~~TRINITY_DN76985_c0_g1_i1.p1  ORF type:complete len:600 (-),score=77.90 TRINITY_DN76985_c0_g1_i1:253-1899(-)